MGSVGNTLFYYLTFDGHLKYWKSVEDGQIRTHIDTYFFFHL